MDNEAFSYRVYDTVSLSAGFMKKYLYLLLWCSSVCFAAEPSVTRQMELRQLLKNDCGACHGLTLQGGMGPALLPKNLAEKSNDFLARTILEGRKGTAMPPWQPFMNREEALWLIGLLKTGVK
jgi:cytochrome c55X